MARLVTRDLGVSSCRPKQSSEGAELSTLGRSDAVVSLPRLGKTNGCISRGPLSYEMPKSPS